MACVVPPLPGKISHLDSSRKQSSFMVVRIAGHHGTLFPMLQRLCAVLPKRCALRESISKSCQWQLNVLKSCLVWKTMFRCYLFVPPWPCSWVDPRTWCLHILAPICSLFVLPVLILLCSELSLLLPLSVKEGLIVLHVLNKLHHVVVESRCMISQWIDIFQWYDGMWIDISYHCDVFIIPANGLQMICIFVIFWEKGQVGSRQRYPKPSGFCLLLAQTSGTLALHNVPQEREHAT